MIGYRSPPPPQEPERERLTFEQFLSLFNRLPADVRFMSSCDSDEYLAIVTWLVQRNNKET